MQPDPNNVPPNILGQPPLTNYLRDSQGPMVNGYGGSHHHMQPPNGVIGGPHLPPQQPPPPPLPHQQLGPPINGAGPRQNGGYHHY